MILDLEREDSTDFSNVGFELKVQHILKYDLTTVEEISDKDELIDYFANHFIMSDFEAKQLLMTIRKKGADYFLGLVEELKQTLA